MTGDAPRHPRPAPGARRPGVLSPYRLTGLAAPMAVWALHLVAVYSLQGVTCGEELANRRIAGLETLTWWVLAMTAAAFAARAWMGLRALRARHVSEDDRSSPLLASRRRFTASVTALLSALSAVAVLFTTIPVLLLPGCA